MHGRRDQEQILLTASECAEQIGISIRALRLYEQYGLISPRRTSKQWRLYGSSEIVRLNEILALKILGLSLRDIAKLLKGQAADLEQTLSLQRDTLANTQERATRGLQVIENLQSKIRSGATPSIDDLTNLARETHMTEPSQDTAAWRRYEQMRPRTEVPINAGLLNDYSGAYETADGTISIVTNHGGQLAYRIVGQSDIDIFPEGAAEFFMKVLPVQIKFCRDQDGRVDGLVHHQNGFEDHATKVALDPILNVEAHVQQRIRDQKPMAESENILRRLIEEHAQGEPNLDDMAPALAALAVEQKEFIQKDLEKAGALKSLSFKGVQQGLDIYDVEFENTKMEWGFAVTHRGKISHLYLRPAL
jgi:DNA-binding transcriptional MerR regulator